MGKNIYEGFRAYYGVDGTYKGKTVAFAGANTGEGFQSEYDQFADERTLERVYILKGGSGTGKSTLLGLIASDAEKAGYPCRRYLCSADAHSLDAVVLDGRICVLDGTAPHIREPVCPGASSELIDLGRYWNSAILETHREEIEDCIAEKKRLYQSAYRILHAAAILEEEQYIAVKRCCDVPKMEQYAARLLRSRGAGMGKTIHVRTCAIARQGLVYTSPWESMRKIVVEDAAGGAAVFLTVLAEKAREKQTETVLSRFPLQNRAVEVCFPSLQSCFTMLHQEEGGDRTIHMSRFYQKELYAAEKEHLRNRAGQIRMLAEDAAGTFAAAGDIHAHLETIYTRAMHFRLLQKETEKVRGRILDTLCIKKEKTGDTVK